jgi:isoleucyl-tRNA synthetase
MDKDYEIRQLRLFQELVRRGLVYRKHKPVYWSPSSRTALAEAELEYNDNHLSHTAYVKFPITNDDLNDRLPGLQGFNGKLYAVIWTTTPWTLPANKAIAVRDDFDYSIVQVGSDAMIILRERLKSMSFLMMTDSQPKVLVDSVKGADLTGLMYFNKLRGKNSEPQPIVHADLVTADSGTGLVHLAPGHGNEDYDVCSAIGIPAFAPITDEGYFTAEAYPDEPEKLTSAPSILAGGGKAVIDLLGDDVLQIAKLRHKYPYDWRTKQPVVIRATAQWFADVESIKNSALKSLQDVQFIPESARRRLESFVIGRSEWCISRQRAWGVPIPALYDENGDAVMTAESIDHIISVIKAKGIDAWFSDDPEDSTWIDSSLAGKYRRSTDTMDVWFDSGSSWTETSGRADIYLEGSDQHRGWFQSSLLIHVAAHQEQGPEISASAIGLAPFKAIITHGFTLDKNGRKMSKSLGNVISPDDVMSGSLLGGVSTGKAKQTQNKQAQGLGPDALRLWVASSDFTKDITISAEVLQFIDKSLVKYRQILKMLLGSLHETSRAGPITTLDRIAMIQLEDTFQEVQKSFRNYEFYKAVSAINRWVTGDLSAFYLEALKDRLYCGDGGGVVEPIFLGFLRMLAPITPVLVEEAWSHRPAWLDDHK